MQTILFSTEFLAEIVPKVFRANQTGFTMGGREKEGGVSQQHVCFL